LNDDEKLFCSSLEKKKSFSAELKDADSKLVLLEETYFLARECGDSNAQNYLDEVIRVSGALGKKWKVNVYSGVKDGKLDRRIIETKTSKRLTVPVNARKIVLGESKILVDSNTVIGSQVERESNATGFQAKSAFFL
jgi:hypothetical protein